MPPGSPNRTPVKRDAPFLEPSFHYLSQFLVNKLPHHVSQWDTNKEKHPSPEPSTSHPMKIHLFLRVPGKGAPSMFPTGSLWTEILLHHSHWSVYSFMSARVPQKKKTSCKMGKNLRSPSTEPHADRRPTYNGVRPGSPRGMLMTLLSLPQCHAALGMILSTLACVDRTPLSSMCLATPNRVYPPHLLPPPT